MYAHIYDTDTYIYIWYVCIVNIYQRNIKYAFMKQFYIQYRLAVEQCSL